MEHGWDAFFGYLGGNVDYFSHRELSDLHVLYRGREPASAKGYMTQLITDASIDFIERQQDRPFFLFVSHECPHFPFQGPGDGDKVVNEQNWTTPDSASYVAMLEDLDSEVGRLLAALDERGLAENTLVAFASDNGGFAGAGRMGPLRGAKGTTFEGGIRVPLILRWPGRIAAAVPCEQATATFDLTRSILELAGAEPSAERLDGYDIVGHVLEQRDNFARTLFWRGRRGDVTWRAVRDGNAKYVRKTDGSDSQEWLFDVARDIGEQNNLMAQREAEANRLKGLLGAWEADVKAAR